MLHSDSLCYWLLTNYLTSVQFFIYKISIAIDSHKKLSICKARLCMACEESWAPKNWCFWTVVLEKTLVSSLDCKEIQPVHPKQDQSWVFIGRTDAESETPILWPPHVKNWLTGKDPDAGRNWGQEEKGTTEDEMAGWHHWLNARKFEWTLGVGDGQGGLPCCNSWGRKDSDMTERLHWTDAWPWRRKWQPTPVFLPGESQGQRSVVGCLWHHTGSDTTEVT